MCGRYSLFAPRNDVADRFELADATAHEPTYNAAPSQSLSVIPDVDADAIHRAEWGLVPPWADEREDGGHVNARAETAAEKPSFAEAFAADHGEGTADEGAADDHDGWNAADAGRCLVPADGFYEWGDAGDGRRPHRIEVDDGRLFAMAGLWTRWQPPDRQAGLGDFGGAVTGPEPIHTFTILTTTANDTLATIHDRMPVILPADEEGRWLQGPPVDRPGLLEPYGGDCRLYAVSDRVNDPSNDDPSVIEPVGG